MLPEKNPEKDVVRPFSLLPLLTRSQTPRMAECMCSRQPLREYCDRSDASIDVLVMGISICGLIDKYVSKYSMIPVSMSNHGRSTGGDRWDAFPPTKMFTLNLLSRKFSGRKERNMPRHLK